MLWKFLFSFDLVAIFFLDCYSFTFISLMLWLVSFFSFWHIIESLTNFSVSQGYWYFRFWWWKSISPLISRSLGHLAELMETEVDECEKAQAARQKVNSSKLTPLLASISGSMLSILSSHSFCFALTQIVTIKWYIRHMLLFLSISIWTVMQSYLVLVCFFGQIPLNFCCPIFSVWRRGM